MDLGNFKLNLYFVRENENIRYVCFQYKRPRVRSYNDEFVVLSEGEEAHWEVCVRILFVYGKLNPGQGYVQVQSSCPPMTLHFSLNLW